MTNNWAVGFMSGLTSMLDAIRPAMEAVHAGEIFAGLLVAMVVGSLVRMFLVRR